jgi:hypothetical protein
MSKRFSRFAFLGSGARVTTFAFRFQWPRNASHGPGHGWARNIALLGLVVLLAGVSVPTHLTTGTANPPSRSPIAATPSLASPLLTAIRSLDTGAGPARGAPMNCVPTGGDGARCGAAAPLPAGNLSPGWNLTSTYPLGSEAATMAFDPIDNYTVLFGGIGGASEWDPVLGSTWLLHNGTWTNWTGSLSIAPRPLEFASMTFDAQDGYVLLFGGAYPGAYPIFAPQATNETWGFVHGAWTNLTSSVAPPVRYLAGMTYDAADHEVVLFGGSVWPNRLLNDTWAYDGGTWTNVTSLSLVTPPATSGEGLAYDSSDGYVLLYGGFSRPYTGNDTWTYLAGNWTQRTPTQVPEATAEAVLVDDPADQMVVLFGGEGPINFVNLTWGFHAGNWTNLTTAGPPAARWSASADYDPTIPAVVVYGGQGNTGLTNLLESDLWYFSGGNWTTQSPTTQPPPDTDVEMVWDAADATVVMWGGGATWTYGHGNWTEIPNATGPGPRSQPMMTYDWADGYVLLFGGANRTSTLGDTWTFVSGNWTERFPNPAPLPRAGGSMTYDATDGYVLLFGGSNFGDTWSYRAGVWTQLRAPGPSAVRSGAAMAYDPQAGDVILFGGCCWLDDTWTFVGGHWTNITLQVTSAPPPLGYAGISNDTGSGTVVLFGGFGSTGGC